MDIQGGGEVADFIFGGDSNGDVNKTMEQLNSTDMPQREMIQNFYEFYQMLKLPYHIVSIVSGALNDAAAKKVGDQNGQKKSNEQTKQYCHFLNSTLTNREDSVL
ncbi:hypothetical protein LXL04_004223 [Taraxacum kok-saghyz]